MFTQSINVNVYQFMRKITMSVGWQIIIYVSWWFLMQMLFFQCYSECEHFYAAFKVFKMFLLRYVVAREFWVVA